MAQLWERQRDEAGNLEPNLWFGRFNVYRLQGHARSLLGTVNKEREEKGGKRSNKVPGSWDRASAEWQWKQRAEAWDAWQREQEEAEWIERRRKIRERDWEQGESLRVLAESILAEGPKFLRTTRKLVKGKDGEPDREVVTIALDGRLAVTAAEKGSQLQRLGAEMETERQRIIHEVEKELGIVLDALAKVLREDDYQRVLTVLSGGKTGETETETPATDDIA